jgi:hypothetical protein
MEKIGCYLEAYCNNFAYGVRSCTVSLSVKQLVRPEMYRFLAFRKIRKKCLQGDIPKDGQMFIGMDNLPSTYIAKKSALMFIFV